MPFVRSAGQMALHEGMDMIIDRCLCEKAKKEFADGLPIYTKERIEHELGLQAGHWERNQNAETAGD